MGRIRIIILIVFGLLAAGSVWQAFNLQFRFSFEDFFPNDDPDLDFYEDFIADFETDINFLLVALKKDEGDVFDRDFLEQAHDFSIKARDLPYIKSSNSLTQISLPIKTPFGFTAIPAIHINKPEKYQKDKTKLLADSRFNGSLISKNGDALVVALKTDDGVMLQESEVLINALNGLLENYNFDQQYILGPAYFQHEMVQMQKREVLVSAIVSGILVCFIMFWVFRRPIGILIALFSIGLGMLLFFGTLSALGRPLNAIAALYPVLMIIVGTSDVIHIMSKYIDELKKGFDKKAAITTAIKEIGLATLLTSATTAIGFASLLTSRVEPIREFGVNAALGVLIAYITVIFFTTTLLSYFEKEQLIKLGRGEAFWNRLMKRAYQFTLNRKRRIIWSCIAAFIICGIGISMVSTNYTIQNNLPRGKKISEDFLYFEKEFAGFRPFELAVFVQEGYQADDYEILQEIAKVEAQLATIPAIESVQSITGIYKSLNQAFSGNRHSAYQLPASESKYRQFKKYADKLPEAGQAVLVSKDGMKARISARAKDSGADNIQELGAELEEWISQNVDSSKVTFRQTGMGLILDKNAKYIRENLLQGLGLAVLIISLVMVLLFKNWRMVIVSLVPNVFPLLLAAAFIGFAGIELEAGVAIVFAIVFGIAVDDTIHFLSKYKLSIRKGMSMEDALLTTFTETGKAICLTSLILFFGFLVMLFSIHPPSVTIGLLISLTLFSALIADLMMIPLLIRWLLKDENK